MSTAPSKAKSGPNVEIIIDPQDDGTIVYRTPDGKDATSVKAYRGWKVQWQTAERTPFTVHFPNDCPSVQNTYHSDANDGGALCEMEVSKAASTLKHYEYYVAADFGGRVIIDDPDVNVDEC